MYMSDHAIIDQYNGNRGDISADRQLPESFIREFRDKVDWSRMSEYQNIPEDVIRELPDKVNWSNISHHQKLSEDL
jgi:hypothetical protein